jgi:nucleoside-diphosphate-sugar epimerase
VIQGEKILISGVSGQVGQRVAHHLAGDNEVWGIARFTDADGRTIENYQQATGGDPDRELSSRDALNQAGVTTRAIDIGSGEFNDLPTDFTYVLHLAWMRADLAQLEGALRTNVEGAGLLLQHCRLAKAALVMSGMGVYSPSEDPWHAYTETDAVGRGATAYAPTSPASKLGVEAVARFCARAFDLPIVITRLNTFFGGPMSFPGMHISAVLDGRTMTAPSDPNLHTPIHADDLVDQLEAMLDAASTPATITNWCGDEDMSAQRWIELASQLSGRPGEITARTVPGSPAGTRADPTRRRSITGPCKVDLTSEFRHLYSQMTTALPTKHSEQEKTP